MIKLLIFDLDNTLFDTYSQLGIKVLDKMIIQMRKLGLTKEQEQLLRKKYIITGFRIVAKELDLSEEVKNIGMQTYRGMDISHITPYEDVKLLDGFKQKKILVTSGLEEVQLKKVKVLKIGDLFEEVIVDESSSYENKKKIFADIMRKHKLKPKEVMIIGDNPESEIAAGNALGIITVQILRRHGMLKGKADYHITDLYELEKLLKDAEK